MLIYLMIKVFGCYLLKFLDLNACSYCTVKTKKTILTEDRLFSLSSVTSPASRREELKKVKYCECSTSLLILFRLTVVCREGCRFKCS